MANRTFTQFNSALQKGVVNIFAKVTFGASGAPTLVTTTPNVSKGIVSITQNGTGDYTFKFGTNASNLDTYPYLLCVSAVFTGASSGASIPAAPTISVKTNSIATVGTASLNILTWASAGTAANPASGEVGYFMFTLGNSTAP